MGNKQHKRKKTQKAIKAITKKNALQRYMKRGRHAKVYDNILDTIGNTPLVKLNRIPKEHGLECEFYAKCEFMNPGGSIKDRIAQQMMVDAENNRPVTKDTAFVEPTSGNTGIGIALSTVIKGYKAVIVTPDKNSEEKLSTMRLLGAEIVQTPSCAKTGDPDHFMTVAQKIVDEHSNYMCLNQFINPLNRETHKEHTGQEILDALETVDMAVMGAGTGGTVTGIAHLLREKCPDCTIVAVDPVGSVIWGGELSSYHVEGIGDDFDPDILDKGAVDKVMHTSDAESFNMAREIIRKEGLLCEDAMPKFTIIYFDTIGNTPLVKLNRIPKEHGLECEFYAKCEFMNPGGSIKDRIAQQMMVDAENNRPVTKDTAFVEPTSGNTGIGIALSTVIKGYKAVIVTPDKNSEEKLSTMRLLGAEIVQTPSCAKKGDPDHFMTVAQKIVDEHSNYMCLNQFINPLNRETHKEHTGQEILDALETVDMAVMGAGTGGTVTGIAHLLREKCPDCTIVAVDPVGSVIWGGELSSYHVEGIGDDFEPDILDKGAVDKVMHTSDAESFNMAREIIRKEGLLCGGSSGAAMVAALKAAKEQNLGPGKKVVVVMPDGIRNYMTKFVCDQWMEAHQFKDPPLRPNIKWWNHPLEKLHIDIYIPKVKRNTTCKDALTRMGLTMHNVAIVVDDHGLYEGVISRKQLLHEATNPKNDENLDLDDSVHKHMIHDCLKVVKNKGNPTVGLVARITDIATFVVVVEKVPNPKQDSVIEIFTPLGVITWEAVWQYISSDCQ